MSCIPIILEFFCCRLAYMRMENASDQPQMLSDKAILSVVAAFFHQWKMPPTFRNSTRGRVACYSHQLRHTWHWLWCCTVGKRASLNLVSKQSFWNVHCVFLHKCPVQVLNTTQPHVSLLLPCHNRTSV